MLHYNQNTRARRVFLPGSRRTRDAPQEDTARAGHTYFNDIDVSVVEVNVEQLGERDAFSQDACKEEQESAPALRAEGNGSIPPPRPRLALRLLQLRRVQLLLTPLKHPRDGNACPESVVRGSVPSMFREGFPSLPDNVQSPETPLPSGEQICSSGFDCRELVEVGHKEGIAPRPL